jgi:methoxymalonate biosynthesis acyl carrier protein
VDPLVQRIVRERLNLDPSPDDDLIAGGLLDSLELVELLVGLEEAFGMDLIGDDLEIEYFRTLSSISAFVAERLDATRDVR